VTLRNVLVTLFQPIRLPGYAPVWPLLVWEALHHTRWRGISLRDGPPMAVSRPSWKAASSQQCAKRSSRQSGCRRWRRPAEGRVQGNARAAGVQRSARPKRIPQNPCLQRNARKVALRMSRRAAPSTARKAVCRRCACRNSSDSDRRVGRLRSGARC
jgi:hypothetical protein